MVRLKFFGLVSILALFLIPIAVGAQNPTKFVWSEAAPTLADSNSYQYKIYIDTSTVGIPISATCIGTASPFNCQAPIPSGFPIGNRNVAMTATFNGAESAKSVSIPLSLTPATPVNFGVQ